MRSSKLRRLLCTPIIAPAFLGCFHLAITVFCTTRAIIFTPEYFERPGFLMYQILGATIAIILLYWASLIYHAKEETWNICDTK